jgi:Cu+-exporting ATPase
MFRRQFIHRITLAGAGTLAAGAAREVVTYKIKGFTCIACAVGLETMLRQQKGVSLVEASYPRSSAHIEFDPSVTTENSLRQQIIDMGFTIAS